MIAAAVATGGAALAAAPAVAGADVALDAGMGAADAGEGAMDAASGLGMSGADAASMGADQAVNSAWGAGDLGYGAGASAVNDAAMGAGGGSLASDAAGLGGTSTGFDTSFSGLSNPSSGIDPSFYNGVNSGNWSAANAATNSGLSGTIGNILSNPTVRNIGLGMLAGSQAGNIANLIAPTNNPAGLYDSLLQQENTRDALNTILGGNSGLQQQSGGNQLSPQMMVMILSLMQGKNNSGNTGAVNGAVPSWMGV